MNSGFLFRYPPLVIFFITILVFVQIPVFLCYDLYASCNNKYHCGDIANVDYPFWGEDRVRGCGKPDLFLNCTGDITLIEMRNVTYRVLSVNMATRSLKIAREDYYSGGICSPRFVNTSLDSNFFCLQLWLRKYYARLWLSSFNHARIVWLCRNWCAGK